MKKKELKDLHLKTKEELQGLMKKAQEELLKSKMDKQAGKLKNAHLPARKRHNLAIIKTLIKEKELTL
jgi:ribosomal protein L29